MTAAHPLVPATQTPDPAEAVSQWTSLQKLAFRLLFTIGGGLLFAVGGVILLVTVDVSVVKDDVGRYPFEPVIWLLSQIGSYLTRGRGVEITRSAGSDLLWFWCLHLGWIVVALLITALWTVMDRRRSDYRRLAASLIVFARFGLAVVMILYGMGKVIPVQMGFMALPDHQLQLVGDTSLFETMWGFVGASELYSVITGLIEVVSGILLLWNRTWLLGAIGSVIATAQIFMLNMIYGVPVKLVAAELFLLAIAITSPYWSNLARVVFNRGETRPVELWSPLGADRRWLRLTGVVAKFGIVGILLIFTAVGGTTLYSVYHTPGSTLDGVWRATSFTIDGREATLNETSPQPWTNVAIADRNKVPELGVVRFVSQAPAGYTTVWLLKVDGDRLELRKRESDSMRVVLRATQPDKDHLVLTGEFDGSQIKGIFERRVMERSRSGFRLISPPIPLDSVR
ncbi:hypothetical protein [Mycobacterium sherrisii]|uniref:DoxX family protein n=1 Tax=Mycobacterium sherrisii TaxID=243061 RepID=A0A1E3STD5_9MYCO|nr:hypothetical protein [Mycobacterium sherrisii]MCV7032453.1 hypothetical protein [Mycobacterium sherrisii]ODR05420.1 hypothetical protein BHQ21_14355 [Mycobacterium sherrisii]ORW73316.1 hypothetical protein AWC25_18120 [Mycobacterium sherrisii]